MGSQGHYSLLQYSEYPERIEFVNIGVVLFADAFPHVLVRFSESARRVEQVFGVQLSQHFQLLKESMESRIKSEFSGSWDRKNIERFSSMRSGKIRLSPLRAVLVKDPHQVVDELFERLVSDEPKAKRGPQARTKLKKRLERSGVVEMLDQKPAPVHLPQGVIVKAPYGYQNGVYNLINAVSLRDNPEQALEYAGKHAIEGQWLSKLDNANGPKRLVIVGDLEGQEQNFASAVEQMLHEHDVGFYNMQSLELLIADIRKHAVNR